MIQKFKVTLLVSMVLAACSVSAETLPTQQYKESTTVDTPLSISGISYAIHATNPKLAESGVATISLTGSSIDAGVDLYNK